MIGDFSDIGFDFEGFGRLGEKKDKPPPPALPPPQPTPKYEAASLLPKWTPIAVAAVGVVIVVGILLTSKGKD